MPIIKSAIKRMKQTAKRRERNVGIKRDIKGAVKAFMAKPTAEGPLWDGNWPQVDQVYGAGISAVLSGERTVDDFAAKICDEAAPAFTK